MLTINQIATANKGALRQACRDAGIAYGNLDVAGMRAQLTAMYEDAHADDQPYTEAELAAQETALDDAGAVDLTELPREPRVFAPEEAPLPVPVPQPVPVAGAARLTSKGVKIERDRPEANGVRMPSAGTACRAVWDYCTSQVEAGAPPTAKTVKAHADASGWNTNNASIEFYRWRTFNGISGRSK